MKMSFIRKEDIIVEFLVDLFSKAKTKRTLGAIGLCKRSYLGLFANFDVNVNNELILINKKF